MVFSFFFNKQLLPTNVLYFEKIRHIEQIKVNSYCVGRCSFELGFYGHWYFYWCNKWRAYLLPLTRISFERVLYTTLRVGAHYEFWSRGQKTLSFQLYRTHLTAIRRSIKLTSYNWMFFIIIGKKLIVRA